jgi:hypothetical protein
VRGRRENRGEREGVAAATGRGAAARKLAGGARVWRLSWPPSGPRVRVRSFVFFCFFKKFRNAFLKSSKIHQNYL